MLTACVSSDSVKVTNAMSVSAKMRMADVLPSAGAASPLSGIRASAGGLDPFHPSTSLTTLHSSSKSTASLVSLRLLLFRLLELESLSRHTNELLALELLQLCDGVFVHWIDREENLEAFSLQNFKEQRVLQGSYRFACQVVDGFLHLGHARDAIYADKPSLLAKR